MKQEESLYEGVGPGFYDAVKFEEEKPPTSNQRKQKTDDDRYTKYVPPNDMYLEAVNLPPAQNNKKRPTSNLPGDYDVNLPPATGTVPSKSPPAHLPGDYDMDLPPPTAAAYYDTNLPPSTYDTNLTQPSMYDTNLPPTSGHVVGEPMYLALESDYAALDATDLPATSESTYQALG